MGMNSVKAALDNAEKVTLEPRGGDGSGSGGGSSSALSVCPVKALGHLGGRYFFLTQNGEVKEVSHRDFSTLGLISLMDGETDWMCEHFPRGNKIGQYDINNTSSALIRACIKAGPWDPSTPIRKGGIWADGGKLVVHCGRELLADGAWHKPGRLPGSRALYVLAPNQPRPDLDQPATEDDGKALRRTLQRWSFATAGGADVLIGWIGAAFLGGAPPWRAHLMVNGPRGCGKSRLTELVGQVLGPAAHAQTNNFTEAALRQTMTGQARALVLDESEADEKGGARVSAVIELLRHMSGGEGAQVLRGSASHQAVSFQITGPAWLSSILHVPLSPQDLSRISHVRLAPLGAVTLDDMKDLTTESTALAALSAQFWGRMIKGWEHFLAARQVYAAALRDKRDCDARQADQLGTILAGRQVMLSDELYFQSDLIEEDLGHVEGLLNSYEEQQAETEGYLLLQHLFSSTPDQWRNGTRETVGELIESAVGNNTEDRKALQRIGMRLEPPPMGGAKRLCIANKHAGLDKLLEGTRWANGVWSQALDQLDGVMTGPAMRFAGAVSRTRIIPAQYLSGAVEPEQGPVQDEEGLEDL
ncbi:MAG: hypothetical protein Alpg2KO_14500 [Alphaproteobacteria bacterium]